MSEYHRADGIVDNAIRHSPRGGEVRIVVRPPAATGAPATLAVEDAGPGVAPEDRPRVFDRFWRAPGVPAGGTGLGLASPAPVPARLTAFRVLAVVRPRTAASCGSVCLRAVRS